MKNRPLFWSITGGATGTEVKNLAYAIIDSVEKPWNTAGAGGEHFLRDEE